MTIEQDTRCAELLGWHKGVGGAISGITGYESPAYWYDADGKSCAPCVTDSFANMYPFSPSTNHEHARVLESEIGRRGLHEMYVEALDQTIRQHTTPKVWQTYIWDMLRATPAQRAAAFIATMEAL